MKTGIRTLLVLALTVPLGHALPANGQPTVPTAGFSFPVDDGRVLEDGYPVFFDQVVNPLLVPLTEMPGFVDGGYLSSSRTIEAMWHSKVPAQVSAIADRARALNINLKNQIVRFTDKELTKASNTLWDALTEAGIRISSIGTTPEYDALAVEGPLISDSLELQEKARKIALQEIGEIPLIFIPYDASEDGGHSFDARGYDASSYDIAAGLGFPFQFCTSGLTLQKPGSGHYSLTAAHCVDYKDGFEVGKLNDKSKIYGHSAYVKQTWGAVSNMSDAYNHLDAAVFKHTSGTSTNSMFINTTPGPINNLTTTSKYAGVGVSLLTYGVPLCISGAGTNGYGRCNIIRNKAGGGQVTRCTSNPNEPCIRKAKIVPVDSIDNHVIFGGGDSGAPVYLSLNGKKLVTSIVQGAPAEDVGIVQCENQHIHAGNICSRKRGRVTSITHILAALPDGFTTH